MSADRSSDDAGVYTQTNDPGGNQVIAYRRSPDGTLTQLGAYDTGGLGTGTPHLASQGSVVLSDDGHWLFAANAGSDDLSVFAVAADARRWSTGSTPAGCGRPASPPTTTSYLSCRPATRGHRPACTASSSATTATSGRWRVLGAS
jgi:6-phosphogluconolactonase